MGGEFMPSLEGDFAVRVLPGSNLQTSMTDAGKILLDKFPEVEKLLVKQG
jgi:hypothetical protein